jgi:hypothetical protein
LLETWPGLVPARELEMTARRSIARRSRGFAWKRWAGIVVLSTAASGCAALPDILRGCETLSELDGERLWLRPMSSVDVVALASTPRVHIPQACWYTNESNTRGYLESMDIEYPMSFEYRAENGAWTYVGYRETILHWYEP